MAIVRVNPQNVVPNQGAIEQQALQNQLNQLGGQRQMVQGITGDMNDISNFLSRRDILNQLGASQQAPPQAPPQPTEEQIDAALASENLDNPEALERWIRNLEGADRATPEQRAEMLAKHIAEVEASGGQAGASRKIQQANLVAPQQAKLAIGNINQMIQNKAVRNFMARDPEAAKSFLQGIGVTGMDGQRTAKARGFIGTPNIITVDDKLYYSGLFEDAQGNVSTKTIPFEEGAELTSRLGQTAEEESLLEVQTAADKTKETERAKLSIKGAEDAIKQVGQINNNISTINKAISAIDEGAQVGAISQYLPTFREATKRFENAANTMGLDVISSVTFGALSKGELDVAMSTAVPKGLDEAGTRRYLVEKRDAQQKLKDYLVGVAREAIRTGKTPAEVVVEMEEARMSQESSQSNPAQTPDPLGLR